MALGKAAKQRRNRSRRKQQITGREVYLQLIEKIKLMEDDKKYAINIDSSSTLNGQYETGAFWKQYFKIPTDTACD